MMHGFLWGISFTVAAFVGLMWAGILSVSYNGERITFGQDRTVSLAQAEPSEAQADSLPEIRVLDKGEPFSQK